VTVLPLVVSAVSVVKLFGDYRPFGDIAQIELNVRKLGDEAVLVGPYSRDGWSHLGPTIYYLAILPYRLLGSSSLALFLVALIVNGGAVAGIALIARRRGGYALMVASLIGCALLIRALGAEFVRDLWNPYVTVLPFAFLVFLTWAMTCGSTAALPMAAFVSTFLVQTHVGYIPLALPLLAWGAGYLVVLSRKAPPADGNGTSAVSPRRLGAALWTTLAVLVALWAAPVVDQATNNPGNLLSVYRYLRSPPEALHTVGDGLRVVADQFWLIPPWLTGERRLDVFEPAALDDLRLPVLLPLVAVGLIALWRSGRVAARRLILTLGIAFVAGVVSVARTSGTVYLYRLYWSWVLALFACALALWGFALLLGPDARATLLRRLQLPSVLALVGLAVVNSVSAVGADVPDRKHSDRVELLMPPLVADLGGDRREVLIRDHGWGSWWTANGLILGLDELGVDARTRPLTSPIEATDLAVAPVYVVAQNSEILDFIDDPSYAVVGYTGNHLLADLERAVIESKRNGDEPVVMPGLTGVALFRQLEPDAADG
jgi:hypothetical protein